MNLGTLRLSLVCLVGCTEVSLVPDDTKSTEPSSTPTPTPTETSWPDPETPTTEASGTGDTGVPLVPAQLVRAPSRDAFVLESAPDSNYGTRIELTAGTWTSSGVPYSLRSFIAFDLGALPAEATDVVAHLDLYAETTSTLYGQGVFNSEPPGHSTLSAPNTFRLRRALDPWDEATVTWNTQPSGDPSLSVGQPSSVAPDQDYLQIDVTALVVDAIAAGETEASLLLHQQTEAHYGEVTFATSDHTDPALHPVLTLDYLVPADL
jgi:hypothetical protein